MEEYFSDDGIHFEKILKSSLNWIRPDVDYTDFVIKLFLKTCHGAGRQVP